MCYEIDLGVIYRICVWSFGLSNLWYINWEFDLEFDII